MIFSAYTLFSRIPLQRNADGVYAADPLWHWDLSRHFDYIADFRLCCPVKDVAEHSANMVRITSLTDDKVFRIPANVGWVAAFKNLLPTGMAMFRALKQTDIAHSGVAAWPFPESYYLLFFRPFLRFKWMVLLESSFYRMPAFGTPTLRQRFSHHFHTFLVRCCMRFADARIFTTERYQSLFLGHSERSLVAPAVWVKEADLRPVAEHDASAPQAPRRTRLIFPSRLVSDKGTHTLINAIRMALGCRSDNAVPFPQIDFMGVGPLEEDCRALAAEYPDNVKVIAPVPYGAAFFDVLRGYDALLHVTVHEGGQPRILYDGFSQALPCIASSTNANKEAITEGETGAFFEAGNAEALASLLIEYADAPDRLHAMGRKALQKARAHTHEQMHRTRERFLIETLNLGETPNGEDSIGDTVLGTAGQPSARDA